MEDLINKIKDKYSPPELVEALDISMDELLTHLQDWLEDHYTSTMEVVEE